MSDTQIATQNDQGLVHPISRIYPWPGSSHSFATTTTNTNTNANTSTDSMSQLYPWPGSLFPQSLSAPSLDISPSSSSCPWPSSCRESGKKRPTRQPSETGEEPSQPRKNYKFVQSENQDELRVRVRVRVSSGVEPVEEDPEEEVPTEVVSCPVGQSPVEEDEKDPGSTIQLNNEFNDLHKGEVNLNVSRSQCGYCYEEFPSRNALFLHLDSKGVETMRRTKSRSEKRESRRRWKSRRRFNKLTQRLESLEITARTKNGKMEQDMLIDSTS